MSDALKASSRILTGRRDAHCDHCFKRVKLLMPVHSCVLDHRFTEMLCMPCRMDYDRHEAELYYQGRIEGRLCAPHALPRRMQPTKDEVDDRVELWHNGGCPAGWSLQDAIEMTHSEYASWLRDGAAIPPRPLPELPSA